MIDLGRMKVPIIEDENGNPTWSLLVGDISVNDAEVGLNYICVEIYNDKFFLGTLTVSASGQSRIETGGRQEFYGCDTKDDYTAFIMAMSIAREYAVEQLHKEMKKEVGDPESVIIEFKNES